MLLDFVKQQSCVFKSPFGYTFDDDDNQVLEKNLHRMQL